MCILILAGACGGATERTDVTGTTILRIPEITEEDFPIVLEYSRVQQYLGLDSIVGEKELDENLEIVLGKEYIFIETSLEGSVPFHFVVKDIKSKGETNDLLFLTTAEGFPDKETGIFLEDDDEGVSVLIINEGSYYMFKLIVESIKLSKNGTDI